MRITAKQLEGLNACQEQLDVFNEEWPDGAEITLENCQRAIGLGLDIRWAAEMMLTATAWETYKEATAPAWKAYDEATAPSREAYNEAIAAAVNFKAEATAAQACNEARAHASKAYDEAIAQAFCEALTCIEATTGAPY